MPSSSRIPSLDGLRALSISFVLLGHFALGCGFSYRSRLVDGGLYAHYGVRIFFHHLRVLVTTLLVQERNKTGKVDLKQFYIRCAYRIFPACYFYLLVVTLVFHSSLPFKYLVTAYADLTSYAPNSPVAFAASVVAFGGRTVLSNLAAVMGFGLLMAPTWGSVPLYSAPFLGLVLTKIGPPFGAPSVIDAKFLRGGCARRRMLARVVSASISGNISRFLPGAVSR